MAVTGRVIIACVMIAITLLCREMYNVITIMTF